MREFKTTFSSPTHQGILFDFDGVLAQTMEDNFSAWKASTAYYGLDIQREDYFPFEGMPPREVVRYLFQHYDRQVPDVDKVASQKDEYYLNSHQFKLYPGVTQLIDDLVKKETPFGMVTGASKKRLQKSVPSSFLSKFDTMVTGDMTTKGKPFPEPYLLGCHYLNLPPEKCIVIENAPLGIQAAKAANIFCIAICSTLKRSFLHEADQIIKSFDQLCDLDVISDFLEDPQS